MFRLLMILSLTCFLTACAGSGYKLPTVSAADTKVMQEKIDARNGTLKVYERSDRQYTQMISSISGRLKKNAKPLCESAQYPSCYFEVKYHNGDTVNAFASEGYKITLYRGLLQHLKNDDEIAAVIGHEMGHHLAHHNEETAQNAAAGAAVSGILAAVIIGAANANNPYYTQYQQQQDSQTIEDMMKIGAHIGVATYSKEQEREADLLGAYLMARAGYNLDRAENMFYALSDTKGAAGGSGRKGFLESHPANSERLAAWQKTIDEIKANPGKLPYAKEAPQISKENSKLMD